MSAATTSLDFDKDALDNLTDEERQAITESEFTDEEIKSLERIANSDDDDPQDDESDVNDDGKSLTPASDKSVSDKVDDESQEDQDKKLETSEKLEQGETQDAPAFGYTAKLPVDYEDQIKSLKSQEDELKAKFKAGEIDFEELEVAQADLTKQREELTVVRAKAEISQEMTEQHAKTAWATTVNRFVASTSNEIDYKKDAEKFADLDQFVKVLANKAENDDKPMEWFLTEAHKRVKVLHGVKNSKEQEVDTSKAIKDAQEKRKPPLGDAPATLAQVPGGDGPGDLTGEFADLDALDGDEYEAAIAKLSPAQREKWVQGH